MITASSSDIPHQEDKIVTGTAPTPLSYRPKVAAGVLGVSRAKLYKMIAAGDLKSYKLGTATLIRHEDLAKLLDEAEPSPSTKAAHASTR